MDKLIQIAIAELGEKEIPGSTHNKRIVEYAVEAGFGWINDDETPWCSIFINWVTKQANLKGSNKLNARSWLNVGIEVNNPIPGDIVIFWRGSKEGWQGHVGIFFGFSKDGNTIYTLGGNQGNQVSISGYNKSNLLGFRRLTNPSVFRVPEPKLRKGDVGTEVKQLQYCLNQAGFDCGTPDGIFGDKTASGLKKLLKEAKIDMIGSVYNDRAKEYLISILQQ